MKNTAEILTSLGACAEAIEWVGRKSLKRAWETCKRGDWLLWVAGKLGVDRKRLVLAACGCVRTALNRVPKGEERPRIAIETAEAWTRGEATLGQVRKAAYADAAYANKSCPDLAAIVRGIIPWSVIKAALAAVEAERRKA